MNLLGIFRIGGTVPASYALYAEFLPREKRAEHLSWLCLSWVVGGVYAAGMAWAIIPNSGWGFAYGSQYQVGISSKCSKLAEKSI